MSVLVEMRSKLGEREYLEWLVSETNALKESHYWEIVCQAIRHVAHQWEFPLFNNAGGGLPDIVNMLEARGAVRALGEIEGEIDSHRIMLMELKEQEGR